MISSKTEAEFGRWRAFFWPIYSHELKKVLPMMVMLFLICFNQTILRNVKDAIVITARSSGVEAIPFIKVWVVLPMAVLLTVIFTKLTNRFSQEKVFYLILGSFLIYFGIFAFILYPLRDWLHPHQFCDYLEMILPSGFKGLIAMFRNWSFTLFYVICELWSTMVLTVLFWGFANEVTKITEARRFYSMLGVVSSFAAAIAGVGANFMTDDRSWETTLNILIAAIILSGCATMLIFRWMNRHVLDKPDFRALHQSAETEEIKSKKKLSMRESFSYLSNSSYLLYIAVIVIAYNLIINLVEVVWKDQLFQIHTSTVDYNRYMNWIAAIVGIIATLTSFFMSELIGRFGWTRAALITPFVMLVTSVGFFGFMMLRTSGWSETIQMWTGMTPIAIAVVFGAAQVCLSKACKFSVFDSTKEMAFIPLSHESKLKGKAAIDGVGSRLGKSGGSVIHQGLLFIVSTVGASAPYVAVIVLAVIVGWVIALRLLGTKFTELVAAQGVDATDPLLMAEDGPHLLETPVLQNKSG